MKYLFFLFFLLSYGSTVAQQPVLPRNEVIEAKIENLLGQMSYDLKRWAMDHADNIADAVAAESWPLKPVYSKLPAETSR